MPKRVQVRGGSTANHALFTGAIREVTVDTDKKVVVAHDGSTAGGFPMARADQALAVANNLSDIDDAAEARVNLGVFSKEDTHTRVRTRQRSNGLYFDPVTSLQRIYCPLTGGEWNYQIGTDPFSLRLVFKVPNTDGVTRTIAILSTASDAIAANGVAIVLSSGILEFRKYGSTTNDYTLSQYAEFGANYEGEVVELLLVRNTTGIVVYVNGTAVTLVGPSSYGTGPGWASSVSLSYFVFGYGVSSKFVGEFYGATIFNYALSADEAEALAIYGIPASDIWANNATNLIPDSDDRDFSAANNWANVDFYSFDAATDLSVSSSGAGQKCNLLSANLGSFTVGRKYLMTFTASNCSGTFQFKGDGGGLTFDSFSTNGTHHVTGILEAATFGDLELVTVSSGNVDIDNISLRQAGAILDLDFTQGGEYQLMDRSSNRKHATIVGSPAFLYPRRFGQIRFTLEDDANTQFLGGNCIPTNAKIMAIVAYPTEDSNTVFLGTTSGGNDIVASVALTQNVRSSLTLAGHFSSTGNIWVKSDSVGRVDFTVIYELVD